MNAKYSSESSMRFYTHICDLQTTLVWMFKIFHRLLYLRQDYEMFTIKVSLEPLDWLESSFFTYP